MPAFHVHWLVAIAAIEEEPKYIKNGFDAFRLLVYSFRENVRTFIDETPKDDKKRAKGLGEKIIQLRKDLDRDIASSPAYDDITCFSAYMCGACGPDFWMCPSISQGGLIPDFAAIHFDLGHYNRTHRQFEVAIERLKTANKRSLQAKVETSYFLGMATHIAADLVIHQLVNVSAGAYHLLEKKWRNENGALPAKIFNTHNKVEHYWDSYVRFRYLGDAGPLFGSHDASAWTVPGLSSLELKFPTAEGLAFFIRGKKFESDVEKAFFLQLDRTEVRINLELPLVFPRTFADRMLAGGIQPFIYKVVVAKTAGAYPKKHLRSTLESGATGEALGYQMKFTGDKELSEKRHLAFFSTELNDEGYRSARVARSASNSNYVTYFACPGYLQVVANGKDTFYHLQSLGPFIASAVRLARKFVPTLRAAFDASSTDLGELGCFWNLDTGTGMQVRSCYSLTRHEVITRLDLVHVFDLVGMSRVAYQRKYPYLDGKHTSRFDPGFKNEHPFKLVHPANPFRDDCAIEEKDGGAFLYQLRVAESPTAPPSGRKISRFFSALSDPTSLAPSVRTDKMGGGNQFVCADIKHRLTLELRTAIADLACVDPSMAGETLGAYLWADEKRGLGESCTEEITEWLSKKHGKCIDYRETGKESEPPLIRNGLQLFSSPLLMNFEKTTPKREIALGKWNNVVPYDQHKKFYGRNFALGTGRKWSLHPTGSGQFDPRADFEFYGNVAPTEQVFFTLFILVATPAGVYDLISHETVDAKRFHDLRCIDCLGVNKVILFYDFTAAGATQLPECCIDNIDNPVQRATDP